MKEIITFDKLLLNILDLEQITEKKHIINNETYNVFIKLLNKIPNFFIELEKTIIDLVKDDKIDTNDINIIIILIQQLYEILYKSKDFNIDSIKIPEICSDIIKFIIFLLVQERKVLITEKNKDKFLYQTNKLIDSCASLLILPKALKSKSCIRSIFGF